MPNISIVGMYAHTQHGYAHMYIIEHHAQLHGLRPLRIRDNGWVITLGQEGNVQARIQQQEYANSILVFMQTNQFGGEIFK